MAEQSSEEAIERTVKPRRHVVPFPLSDGRLAYVDVPEGGLSETDAGRLAKMVMTLPASGLEGAPNADD